MKKVALSLLILFAIFMIQPPSIRASENAVVGPQKTIVILAKFPDIENEHTPAYIDNLVFGTVNDFFKESSYGQLWLTGTTTSIWYELPHTLDYYWEENLPYRPDQGIIRDVFELVSEEVNFNDYDRVLLLYPEASYKRGYTLWTPIAQIGVAIESRHDWEYLAHEYTHVLGYCAPNTLYLAPPTWPQGWEEGWGYGSWLSVPDLYYNIRDWGLMGGAPAHHLAWTKIRLGWIPTNKILTVNSGETVTSWVDPLEITTDNIQVIKTPVSDIYYLLVETRKNIGFDENITPGVIISFGRDYGYFEGNWEFSVDKVPRATFSFSPSSDAQEWRLSLTADDQKENWAAAQVDVYLDGENSGKVWDESPYGGFQTSERNLTGPHILSVSENDQYGTAFSRYSRGTFGQIERPVGSGSPGFSTDSEASPLITLSAIYGGSEYREEYENGYLSIVGYYAFQEGDRISFPDLNLTITMLEEENGSYRIRVGPPPSIQQDDAGSNSDAGGRGSPLEIQPGSYQGYLGVSDADYRDFYKINVIQGQKIDASMTPLSDGETWIRLYGTENYDARASDSGWVVDGGDNHIISYTAPSTGSLYLGVFRSSGTGEYQLDVSLSDIPTALTPAFPSLEVEPGESKTITATLARFDGVPLADRSVTWSAEAGEITFLSEVTDNQGQVSATYTASTLRPKVTATVSFEGADNYENSTCQFELALLIGVSPENLVSDTWLLVENVEAGTEVIVEIENGDLRRVTITSTKSIDNLELRAQQADALPSGVSPPLGEIYSYFNVLSTAENDIKNVQIKFRVDRSWIHEQGIDSGSIALSRYEDGEWKGLQTVMIGEDNTYFYYSAAAPGISWFAVIGERITRPDFLVLVIVGIVAALVAGFYFWPKFISSKRRGRKKRH